MGEIWRFFILAEKEGFEPSIRRTVYRISSPAHSTTLPPLQVVLNGPRNSAPRSIEAQNYNSSIRKIQLFRRSACTDKLVVGTHGFRRIHQAGAAPHVGADAEGFHDLFADHANPDQGLYV